MPIPEHRFLRSRGLRSVAAVLAVLAVGAAACSSSKATDKGQAANRKAKPGESLKGVCPSTVVVQTNWVPQAEDGYLFRLLGKDVDVDAAHKKVTAPLVSHGADTGVKLEIRSGGPANNYTPAIKVAYQDNSVTLAGGDMDQMIQFSKDTPMKAVFAPMDLSPVVLMWNKQMYPTIHSIGDVGQTPNVKVRTFPGATYVTYLVQTGVLKANQIDPSYDGSPTAWLSDGGKEIQQGFITNEPYAYEHDIKQWAKPVGWALVGGNYKGSYKVYPETMNIRSDKEAQLAPCLQRLVPDLQRSMIDYINDPKSTNDLIVKLTGQFSSFPYAPDQAANAAKAMKTNNIVGNGPNKTLGDFDAPRVSDLFTHVLSVYATQHVETKAGLKAEDIYTNKYLNPDLGL
jgi:hypothetical protein